MYLYKPTTSKVATTYIYKAENSMKMSWYEELNLIIVVGVDGCETTFGVLVPPCVEIATNHL